MKIWSPSEHYKYTAITMVGEKFPLTIQKEFYVLFRFSWKFQFNLNFRSRNYFSFRFSYSKLKIISL